MKKIFFTSMIALGFVFSAAAQTTGTKQKTATSVKADTKKSGTKTENKVAIDDGVGENTFLMDVKKPAVKKKPTSKKKKSAEKKPR